VVWDLAARAAPGPRRPGVFVAGQTPLTRINLARLLERDGFEVWAATSGSDAIQTYFVHAGEVDLLLVQDDLPDLPAPAFYARLQSEFPGVPCCFFSLHAGGAEAEAARRLGATVVPWPTSVARLLETLWAVVLALWAVNG
jgi:DNA-binding NarL/FixJ family response regulator